jgi:hypothetical protein
MKRSSYRNHPARDGPRKFLLCSTEFQVPPVVTDFAVLTCVASGSLLSAFFPNGSRLARREVVRTSFHIITTVNVFGGLT